MEIAFKQRLLVGASVALAVVAGREIAHGNFLLAGLLAGFLLLWLAQRITGLATDAFVAGLVLIGYLVGNRGFAQLQVPGLPLLPGELALGVGTLFVGLRATQTKTLPVRRSLLDFTLLSWLAFGAIRLRQDFPAHGFLALRDFALLYYAVFFFLAQGWGAQPASRRWLERCLTIGFALTAPVFLAFAQWPEVFVRSFAILGTPLIYVKSDVAGGFMVAGAFWFLGRFLAERRGWWLALTGTNLVGVAFSNSRAALVALAIAGLWLALARDWRRLKLLAGLAVAGLLLVLASGLVGGKPWTLSPAYRLYESALSTVDFEGTQPYHADDLGDKPENNQFRLTWWRAVVDETVAKNPWIGLGFGYDLADQFTRRYYPEGSEEFSARSPHNFPLTVFGRMGAVGLAFLATVLAALALRTWRAGRRAVRGDDDGTAFTLLLGVWAIFTSACFGVVLEGPMGAAVFWTLLGLATPATDEKTEADLRPAGPGPDMPLRTAP